MFVKLFYMLKCNVIKQFRAEPKSCHQVTLARFLFTIVALFLLQPHSVIKTEEISVSVLFLYFLLCESSVIHVTNIISFLRPHLPFCGNVQ
jgi:hypothetical protein